MGGVQFPAMTEDKVFPVPEALARASWCDEARYRRMYAESIEDPEKFWAEQAKRIDWIAPFKRVKNTSFDGDVSIRWYEGGRLNASANCVDRHLAKRPIRSILWEDDLKNPRGHVSGTPRESARPPTS